MRFNIEGALVPAGRGKAGGFAALLLLVSLVFTACGDNTATTAPAATAAPAATTQTSATTAAATTSAAPTTAAGANGAAQTPGAATTTGATGSISVVDASGTTITLPAPAKRVVCIGPPCIELLADLEIVPVASTFMNLVVKKEYFGDLSKQVTEIGGTTAAPDLEQIARAKPDLIIGEAGFNDDLRTSLSKTAPYFLAKRAGLTEPYDNLRLVGKLTGKADKAEEVIKKFDARLAAYKAKSPKDKTFVFMANYVLNGQVATNPSAICLFVGQVTKGCVLQPPANVNPRGMVNMSLEKILEVNPDALIMGVASTTAAAEAEKAKTELLASPFWKELPAVKSGQVYEVDTLIWFRTQLRSLSIMLDDAMTQMYPTIFPTPLS